MGINFSEALHIFPLVVFLSKEYILNRVTVHNRGTFPLLDEHGLDIKPNTATNIAIERVSLAGSRRIYPVQSKKVVIKREAAPYGTCMKDWSETGMNEELVKTTEGVRIPYAQGVRELNKLTHNFISHLCCTILHAQGFTEQHKSMHNYISS